MEQFTNLKYTRPDGEALLAGINGAAKAFQNAESYPAAREIFLSLNRKQEHFHTMEELASIRNSIDTRDAFYEKEMEYFHSVKPRISVEMKKFHKVFLESRFLPDFERELGQLYIRNVKSRVRLAAECNIDLQVGESMLVQEYYRTAAAPQAEFHGETLNFYGLLKKMQDPDREIRKEAMKKWSALYESISRKLDDIYRELVEIRLQMAENLGFPGYEEMVFLQNKRYTYTPEDVAAFREQILRHIEIGRASCRERV